MKNPPRVLPVSKPVLTTSRLCRTAGVTRGQLRVYERLGLIFAPRRTARGYRDYDPDTATRLNAIRQMKEVGFTLKEIAAMLSTRDEGGLDGRVVQSAAADLLHKINARIARLEVTRDYVSAVANGDLSALGDPDCAFLVKFMACAEPRQKEMRSMPTRRSRTKL